ncbi:MAG: phospholipase [Alphaproteobacteria bacterium]|nr:phospholipase [Alphaproteobacteria bacterium]MDA8008727.1 phospholipase [Alphaproteobacteria bacterium]
MSSVIPSERRRDAARSPADALVVFLHGLGADGSDLLPLADAFSVRLPRARFAAPDAPHLWGGTGPGREWFPIRSFAALEVFSGTRRAWPSLRTLIADERRSGERLVLAGFSQGAMMALYGVSRRDLGVDAVVSFAGCLLYAGGSGAGGFGAAPALLLHGEDDGVVPYSCLGLSAWNLRRVGHEVETVSESGLGHGISQAQLERASEFLVEVLG